MLEARAGGVVVAELISDLQAAEALWRRLEADPAVLQTPYQRFDWIAAYLRSTGQLDAARVAVLRDAEGRVRLLLPLTVQRAYGLRVARTVGDTHANYHMPLFATRDAAAIPPGDIVAALVQAGRAAGIDLYALQHQPRMWEGAADPLAATGEPEASDGYGLMLGPDPDATVRRVFSADARKKLRSKEKRLIEAKGAVAYRRAGTPEEVAAFLAAFYAQKAARFAGMGIADPYADPSIRAFLTASASGPNPALEIYALCLAESGRVLATFCGAVSESRFQRDDDRLRCRPRDFPVQPGRPAAAAPRPRSDGAGTPGLRSRRRRGALQGQHLRRDHRPRRDPGAREPPGQDLWRAAAGPHPHQAADQAGPAAVRCPAAAEEAAALLTSQAAFRRRAPAESATASAAAAGRS